MKKWCKIYLIPLLCVLTLVFSCREKPDPPTYYIPDAYKSYIAFQPGTYWVYEDSVSGVLDSVVVVDFQTGINPDPYDEPGEILRYEEYIEVETHSYFTSFNSQWGTSNICGNSLIGNGCWLTSLRRDGAGESPYTRIAAYPFDLGSVASGDESVVAVYPSLLLDSTIYLNVTLTLDVMDENEDSDSTYYFFGSGAGIVRKEVKTVAGNWRIWKLKRYQAVR